MLTVCPTIIPRCQWEAKPYRGTPTILSPPLSFLFIHHTHSPSQPCLTFEECSRDMRAMQHFHQNDRGWDDIGYRYNSLAFQRQIRHGPVDTTNLVCELSSVLIWICLPALLQALMATFTKVVAGTGKGLTLRDKTPGAMGSHSLETTWKHCHLKASWTS